MSIVANDIQKVADLLNVNENGLNEEVVKEISKSIIFYKNLKLDNEHYLKSLVQDALGILDSLRFKSKRYYYFILRSYIENFLRVILMLDDQDETGVLKLFRDSKKLLNDDSKLISIFDMIEANYSECCLFVHSNIKSGEQISEFLKVIIERNDFEENLTKNEYLIKFNTLIHYTISTFIACHSNIIEDSFYRNFDMLRELISEKDYELYREKVKK